MKSFLLLGIILFSGCQSTLVNKDEPSRFEKLTIVNDSVIKDKKTALMWAESYGSNGQKSCQAHHSVTNEQNDKLSAKKHCQNLQFAGFSDWRVPTALESQEYIKAMQEHGLTPYYAHPSCPRLLALSNGVVVVVNTHNSIPVGALRSYQELSEQSSNSFGVKCVRELQ